MHGNRGKTFQNSSWKKKKNVQKNFEIRTRFSKRNDCNKEKNKVQGAKLRNFKMRNSNKNNLYLWWE